MAVEQLDFVLRHLRHLAGARVFDCLTDGQLLDRFLKQHDEEAFVTMLRRHGPMVLGVCRRLLGPGPDAEDAFQATFLVLVRRARSLDRRGSLAAWLYGVAQRVSTRARADGHRRRTRERQVSAMTPHIYREEGSWHDLRPVLDAELGRLPLKYRAPLILCYLEGKTHEQAARELGWPTGSMSRRLARSRELLHDRLTQRGVTLSAAALSVVLTQATAPAAVPATLSQTTVKAALALTAGKLAAGAVSFHVAKLAGKVSQALWLTKIKLTVATLLVVTLVVGGAGVAMKRADGEVNFVAEVTPASEKPKPGLSAPPEGEKPKPESPAPTPPVKNQKEPEIENNKEEAINLLEQPLPAGAVTRIGKARFWLAMDLQTIALSPDNRLIAFVTGSSDQYVHVKETLSGKDVFWTRIRQSLNTKRLAFSKSGNLLIADNGAFWDLKDKDRKEMNLTAKAMISGTVSRDGMKVALIGKDSGIIVLNLEDIKGLEVIKKQPLRKPLASAFSPDGKLLALIGAGGQIEGSDKPQFPIQIVLYDLANDKTVSWFDTQDASNPNKAPPVIAFAPDGNSLATAHGDDSIRFWDVASAKKQVKGGRLKESNRVANKAHASIVSLAFVADGKSLLAGYSNGSADMWVVGKSVERHRIWQLDPIACKRAIFSISPDGRWLLRGTEHGHVQAWNVGNQGENPNKGALWATIRSIAYSPDGQILVTSSSDSVIKLWNPKSGGELRTLANGNSKSSHSPVAFAPDGRSLVAVADHVIQWDTTTGKVLHEFRGPVQDILATQLTSDGKNVVTAGCRKPVQIWNVEEGKKINSFESLSIGEQGGQCLAISPDGKLLAAGTKVDSQRVFQEPEGLISVWDISKGPLISSLGGHPRSSVYGIMALAFTPDGRRIVYAEDRLLYLCDKITGMEIQRFPGHSDVVLCLALSPDGRLLASGSLDGTLRLWEVRTGKEIRRFGGHKQPVYSLTFSPDGKRLASGSADTTALIWSVSASIKLDKPMRGEIYPESIDDLKTLWRELSNAEVARAFQAQTALTRAPDLSSPFLKVNLSKAKPPDYDAIDRLITDLGSELPWEWDEARLKLMALGEIVEEPIRMAIKKKPPPEVLERMQDVLTALKDPANRLPSPDELRQLRAIAVLEHIGTAEAKQTLKDLATGYANARLTREAHESLNRLTKMR